MSGANELYQGSTLVPLDPGNRYNYKEMRMAMQVVSLSAAVDSPWGTGLSLLVPYAILRYDDATTDLHPDRSIRSDAIGDSELRLRQNLLQPFDLKPPKSGFRIPRLFAALGVVIPHNSAYSSDATKELSISRGAWWVIEELEAHFDLPANFGVSLTGGMRQALQPATNGESDPNTGIGWGSEYRASLSGRYTWDMPVLEGLANVFVPKRLLFLLNGEYLYRSQSTVVENVDAGRVPFDASGGRTVSVTPTFMVGYNDAWSVTASARVPVYRFVNGEQPVQYTGYYFSLNWAWSSTPKRPELNVAAVGAAPTTPEISKLLVPGKYTLIDYWATWCEPCGRLGVQLERELPQKAGVALARVDATAWEAEDWSRFLPGVPGIPVLDIYDRQGKMLIRLQGDDCFAYAQHLPADATEVAQ